MLCFPRLPDVQTVLCMPQAACFQVSLWNSSPVCPGFSRSAIDLFCRVAKKKRGLLAKRESRKSNCACPDSSLYRSWQKDQTIRVTSVWHQTRCSGQGIPDRSWSKDSPGKDLHCAILAWTGFPPSRLCRNCRAWEWIFMV